MKPLDHVRAALGDTVPPDVLAKLPRKFHLVGTVLLLQGCDDVVAQLDEPTLRRVGEAYLAVPQLRAARSVALEVQSPHGELRVPTMAVIAGAPDTRDTVHTEGGVRYCLDPTHIMFSSGNVNERMHFRTHVRAAGEVVVDMFAGVGYFTLPLARSAHGPPAVIYALELNPESAAYLVKGARLNKVSHIVSVIQGDNREPYVAGCANRVLMGYIPTPVGFIDRALDLLCPEGGIVHYHYVAGEHDQRTMPLDHFANKGHRVQLLDMRLVKNYAPHLYHCVADLQCVRDK